MKRTSKTFKKTYSIGNAEATFKVVVSAKKLETIVLVGGNKIYSSCGKIQNHEQIWELSNVFTQLASQLYSIGAYARKLSFDQMAETKILGAAGEQPKPRRKARG